jgi:uncharacterized protein (TIGR03435 family)
MSPRESSSGELKIYRRTILLALVAVCVLSATQGFAQTTPAPSRSVAVDAHASFTVATIKPHDPASQHQGWEAAGDRVGMFDTSVEQLIVFAYSVNRRQIVDAPAWVGEDRYDIDGKSDTDAEPTLPQQQEMIRHLLSDRFGLKFHREQRELSVYAVQIAKGGAKLAAAANPSAPAQEHSNGHGFETTQTYTNASIGYFILVRQIFADRPLVDRTGLTGRYDFKLNYSYNETGSAPGPNAPPGLFTAVQEQLGLKFQPTKASVEVFVLDHVDRPSEN